MNNVNYETTYLCNISNSSCIYLRKHRTTGNTFQTQLGVTTET